MAIESICSSCGQRLSVADEHAGKQAKCPACGAVYQVPTPASSPGSSGSDGFDLTPKQSSENVDLFGETSAGQPSGSGSEFGAGASSEYWMRAADGSEYGPVDQPTLQRWFEEGRVADNYSIRQGAGGDWIPASQFRATAASPAGGNANPFASGTSAGGVTYQGVKNYAKPDQSGLVLAMGILSFLACVICGIFAVIIGGRALKDIDAGLHDPANKGLIQVGYYMGIASLVIHVFCFGGWILLFAIGIAAGG